LQISAAEAPDDTDCCAWYDQQALGCRYDAPEADDFNIDQAVKVPAAPPTKLLKLAAS
jgi:hypothetical protein